MSSAEKVLFCRRRQAEGFTVLEVVIAIFIFGLVSTALFNLMIQTDRIRGRALYLENCSRLAASEAERLRSIAAENAPVEDSMYTTTAGKIMFTVQRKILDNDVSPDYLAHARKPVAVEIRIAEERSPPFYEPLYFKLLIGQERP